MRWAAFAPWCFYGGPCIALPWLFQSFPLFPVIPGFLSWPSRLGDPCGRTLEVLSEIEKKDGLP